MEQWLCCLKKSININSTENKSKLVIAEKFRTLNIMFINT